MNRVCCSGLIEAAFRLIPSLRDGRVGDFLLLLFHGFYIEYIGFG